MAQRVKRPLSPSVTFLIHVSSGGRRDLLPQVVHLHMCDTCPVVIQNVIRIEDEAEQESEAPVFWELCVE